MSKPHALIFNHMLGIQPYPSLTKNRINQKSASEPLPQPQKPQALQPHHARNLPELAQQLRSLNSPLNTNAVSFVFADGKPGNLMVIGEAPGAQEDLEKKPFVGKSGALLMRAFQSINLHRTHLYISNVSPWRPTNNRTPTPSELQQLKPFVLQHIALAAPPAVILVGSTPLTTLFGTELGGITKAHGQWHSLQAGELTVPAIAIYHPAYLLRSPSKKKDMWFDMLSIQEFLQK